MKTLWEINQNWTYFSVFWRWQLVTKVRTRLCYVLVSWSSMLSLVTDLGLLTTDYHHAHPQQPNRGLSESRQSCNTPGSLWTKQLWLATSLLCRAITWGKVYRVVRHPAPTALHVLPKGMRSSAFKCNIRISKYIGALCSKMGLNEYGESFTWQNHQNYQIMN